MNNISKLKQKASPNINYSILINKSVFRTLIESFKDIKTKFKMKNLKKIGILVLLSMTMCVMSQNPTARSMNRSIKALTRMQQMMGMKDEPEINAQKTVSDIDGNEYKTVKIGNQTWMAEDLRTKHYRNGDSIAFVSDSTSWVALKSVGAYCYVYDNIENSKKGGMYNYFAIADKRNIAPKGWHVATIDDWKTLTNTLAGVKLKEQGLTEILQGGKLNLGAAGLRQNGTFGGVNQICFMWSSTQYDNETVWVWIAKESNRLLSYTDKCPKSAGCKVRCVKDVPIVKPTTKSTKKKK
ncbi:MAG: fibrobacter succinogenes major paralogous domain-containing protein [Paludibacter sp.]